MKVLVTGANGFLGSWLTRSLVNGGHEVFALVRAESDL
ncbi:MAG: NAD(P)-dependent oxidoreductase, partial [Proteobacteria bacterium]